MPTKTLTNNDVSANLTQTTTGKVLDATQGKVLDQKVTDEATARTNADNDILNLITAYGMNLTQTF